jgi:2-amino-4-hydroxy-6-hydroxymethyldihydropteridine diphosphokinase
VTDAQPGSTKALAWVPRFRAFVGMGGNIGDVRANLISALAGIADLPGSSVECVSPLYETRPVDATGPNYLNAVAAVQTALAPQELLNALLALETAHDRLRPYRHAPRTLDLDLLWHGGAQRASSSLQLPHPRMMQRAFVLAPLADVLAMLPEGDDRPTLPDAAQRQLLADAQGIVKKGPLAQEIAPK